MFKEFNVEFQNVEMIGGADNLLENTKVTKVVMSGDNKMSSLDSTFKNCSELDNIQGGLDLNGVSDIDNILEGNSLIKSIDLKNINNENISASNPFTNVEEINIGGDSYNKKSMQNVIASKGWTFDNITYIDAVKDNIITKEVNVIDDNKLTIKDTLEQKARGFEVIGQTYENLVVGNGEVTLLDELTLESIDGSTKAFNPHIEQPVCVETIEGETYQNLVNGKGEYKLTDTFSTTWTESNNSIDNPPSVIEIPEIWGNTIQDENDLNIIQSVGDLYVDENGEAILDEDGNKQYKLEIESKNTLFDEKYLKEGYKKELYNGRYIYHATGSIIDNGLFVYDKYKFKEKTQYHIKFEAENINNLSWGSFVVQYTDGTNESTSLINKKGIFVSRENKTIKKIGCIVEGRYNPLYIYADSIIISETENDDDLIKTDKTTILMPCQLSRIKGSSTYDVTDKLLFNKDKGTYIIEKNINTYTTPTINYTGGLDINFNFPSDMVDSNNLINNYPFIIEGAKVQGWSMGNLSEFAIKRYSTDKGVRLATSSSFTNEEISTFLSNKNVYYVTNSPQTIETKILEKPSLETYLPTTYISTNSEVQPSQMTVNNKKVDYIPLGLQANTDYTLQLDSTGKDDKPITVNLGGTETTIQPTNDTKKHHKVVVRTPGTLTAETLELSGEGVTVNDVMLFQGGSNDIKQDVGYIDGIESIGELQGDGTYKIDILTHNGKGKTLITEETLRNAPTFSSGGSTFLNLGIKPVGRVKVKASFDSYFTIVIENFNDNLQKTNTVIGVYNVAINSSEKTGNSDGNNLCIGFRHTEGGHYIAGGQGKDSIIELFKTGRLSLILECEDKNIKHSYERQSTQSILLPQPLNKIGAIKDKFYWDDDKGHYCIEDNAPKIYLHTLDWEYTTNTSIPEDEMAFVISNYCQNNNILLPSFNIE